MPTYEVTGPDDKRYRVTAPEGASQTEVLDRVKREAANTKFREGPEIPSPTWGEFGKDLGRQAVLKRAAGVLPPIHGLYRGADWLGESITGHDFLPDIENFQTYQELHEPAKTTAGRYVGAAAEGLGTILPFGMGALGLAAKGAENIPRGAAWLARPYAVNPARAAAIDLSSGVGGGLAQQGAEDAGAGPVGQTLAALGGGIAGPLAMSGALRYGPGILRSESGALRLPGSRPGIGHNQGPPLDPLPPEGTPGGPGGPMGPPQQWSPVDQQTLQYITDTLRAEGKTPADIDEFMRQLDWARRYHTIGGRRYLPDEATRVGGEQYLKEGMYGGPGMSPPGPPTPLKYPDTYSEAQRLAGFAEMTPGLQQLVGHEFRHNLEAARVARPVFEARQHGYVTGAEPEAALNIPTVGRYERIPEKGGVQPGMFRRVRDSMRRALRVEDETHHQTGRTAAETDELILADQRAKADKTFAAARAAGENTILHQQPEVAQAFENLKAAAARDDLTPDIAAQLNWMIKQYAPSGTLVKNIADFDRARRVVSERIGGFTKGHGGHPLSATIAGEMSDAQNALVNAVRNIDPENAQGLGKLYGKGIDEFGTDAQMRRDLQFGRDMYAGTAPRQGFDNLSREAQNRAKLGYLSEWSMANAEKQGTDITKQMRSDKHRQDMAYMIERSGMRSDQMTPQMTRNEFGEMVPTESVYRDRPERLARQVGFEEGMIGTREAAQGGPATAQRLATSEIFDTLHTVKEIVKGASGGMDVLQRIGAVMLNKVFGMDAAVSANAMRMLLSNNPTLQLRMAAELKMRLGSQTKVERFNQLMKQAARTSVEQVRPGTVGPERRR